MSEVVSVKKSIFIQKSVRKTYDFETQSQSYSEWDGTIGGYAIKTRWIDKIVAKYETIEEKTIFTCNLEMPLLKFGDEFYIEEFNKLVKIDKTVRTSSDNVCYYVSDEVIEDEISKESLTKAEILREKFVTKTDALDKKDATIKEQARELRMLRDEIYTFKNLNLFKRIFRRY